MLGPRTLRIAASCPHQSYAAVHFRCRSRVWHHICFLVVSACGTSLEFYCAFSPLANSGFTVRFHLLRIPASLRAFVSCDFQFCCAFSPLANFGFAARIPSSLRAFAYCKIRLHCALSSLANSGDAARFSLLPPPASLLSFVYCEFRLRRAHSGFTVRFRFLRIPASIISSEAIQFSP